MTAAPLDHHPQAQHQGEAIAGRVVAALHAGTSGPDHVMRALLRVIADSGYMLPPSGLLRGLCAGLQREIENATAGNSGNTFRAQIAGGNDAT